MFRYSNPKYVLFRLKKGLKDVLHIHEEGIQDENVTRPPYKLRDKTRLELFFRKKTSEYDLWNGWKSDFREKVFFVVFWEHRQI